MEIESNSPLWLTIADALWSPQGLNLSPVPRNPANAARVWIARGKYPLPVHEVCGRQMVRRADVVAYTDAHSPPAASTSPLLVKRGRGRPRKTAVEAKAVRHG